MKRSFFYFAWRELTRSANLNKNRAAKGVLIFLALYFSLIAVFMGFELSSELAKTHPDNQISAFNALIFNCLACITNFNGFCELFSRHLH